MNEDPELHEASHSWYGISMRWSQIAPLTLTMTAACATIDKHVTDHDPPPGWCEDLPAPFAIKYDDGSTFLDVKNLEGKQDAIELTYYDRSGAPILVERTVKDKALYFAVFYGNGQKRIAGGYRIEEDQYLPATNWERYDDSGSPDAGDMPDDFFLYRPMVIEEQPPASYPEPRMYIGFPGNVCMMVCVDEGGKLVGGFPIEKSNDAFNAASYSTYSHWQYEPRKIGDVTVPSCAPIKMRFRP
jgi:hypothetical protein